jgi:cysteinyl-tRNA synthetase
MEAISGKKPLVKYWMHIGFLTVNGQKMSKSLGNFIIIGDFLKRCPVNYLRFFVLKNSWKSPMDYSESALIEVKSAVDKIEEFLRRIKEAKGSSKQTLKLTKELKDKFYQELADDFNTPKAFAVIFDFIKKTNELLDKEQVSKKEAVEVYKFFEEINKIFGIINFKKVNRVIPATIKKLAKEREDLRKKQQWQKADEVRKEIERQGFLVDDTKDGSIIKSI